MKLRDLKEKRARIIGDIRALIETAETETRDLNDQEEGQYKVLQSDLKTIEANIERTEFLDDAERRMQGQAISGTGETNFDSELRNFSLVRAVAANANLNVDAGREIEVSQELATRMGVKPQGILVPMQVFEQRVMSSSAPAGGPGSNLIATDHLGGQYIDLMRAKLRINALGARVLSGLSGNVDIPKAKSGSTAGWVAEDSALSSSGLEFQKVSMTPKHAGCLTEFSRNMLQQTSPDIEALVRSDFAAVLAEAVDKVAIKGGGPNEPTGILQTNGIASIEAGDPDGGPLTLEATANLIGAVDELDVDASNRGFLGTNKVKTHAMKILDADNRPMRLGTVFHGERHVFSSLVPSDGTKGAGTDLSSLIYGNWSDLLIGYWSAFDLLVNPYESNAYSKGNVQVRGMLTCDVAVRHAESFAAITDINTGA